MHICFMEKFSPKEEKSKAEKEQLCQHLTHYPAEAGRPSDEQMFEFALQLGRAISVKVSPQSRDDGWYVNINNGTQRVATYDKNPPERPPQDVYLVYLPQGKGGKVEISRSGVMGVEFRTESVDSRKK